MRREVFELQHKIHERHWWFSARRVILGAVVEDALRGGVPAGVLYDLGCGVGANLPVLRRFGEVVGVDESPEAVAFCESRGYDQVRLADLNQLAGLPDGSGSVALLADVLEHLDDEEPCLRAVHRLLAPGGLLVVTVPAYRFLWGPSDRLAHHRRRYTVAQLRRVVGRHFRIERTTYFNTFLFGVVVAGRLLERLLGRSRGHAVTVPAAPVNFGLRVVFQAERSVVRRWRFPFGVSILCLARKPPSGATPET